MKRIRIRSNKSTLLGCYSKPFSPVPEKSIFFSVKKIVIKLDPHFMIIRRNECVHVISTKHLELVVHAR